MTHHLTKHAQLRGRQRAMPLHLVEPFLAYADVERPGREGVACLRLSGRAARELEAEGACPDLISKLRRSEYVLSRDGAIITIIRRRSDVAFGRRASRPWVRRAR